MADGTENGSDDDSDAPIPKTPQKNAPKTATGALTELEPTQAMHAGIQELLQAKASRGLLHEIMKKTTEELKIEMAKEKTSVDLQVVRVKFMKLGEIVEKVNRFDDQIMQLMWKVKAPHDSLRDETNQVDELHDQWVVIKVCATSLLSPESSEGESRSSDSKRKSLKYPKVTVKAFSGELIDWLPFWAQFKQYHEDKELDDAQKFHFLVQLMGEEEENRARDLVKSYPQTAENYPKAIEALQQRFANPKILQQLYVKELIKMMQEKAKIDSVGKLYDKLECHLRSLETIGITISQFSVFLHPMVQSCLPEEVIKGWQQSAFYGKDGSTLDPPQTDLQLLMQYLEKEVLDQQQRNMMSDGCKASDESNAKKMKFEEETPITAAGLHGGKARQQRPEKVRQCIFCQRTNHLSSACFRVKAMPFEKRQEIVRQNNACFVCLNRGHKARKCRAQNVKCNLCGSRHHHVMCVKYVNAKQNYNSAEHQQNTRKSEPQEKGESSHSTSSMNASNKCRADVLLDVEVVRLFGSEGREKVVRLFYDKGAQGSSILRSTAEQIGCVNVGEEVFCTALFGGVTTEAKSHRKFEVNLSSFDYKVSKRLVLLEEEDISAILPRIPWNEKLCSELKEKAINPSDFVSKSPSEEVEILIGANLYPLLVTGKTVILECGLIATQTIFGWTLSGPLNGGESTPSNSRPTAKLNQQTMRLIMDPVRESQPDPLSTAMMSVLHVPQLWSLDIIGITDPVEHKKKAEHDAMVKDSVMKSISRQADGRYSVCLPWIGKREIIPNNYFAAKSILESMTKSKINSPALFQMVNQVINKWLIDDYVEVVDSSNNNFVHYLPHHPVFNPKSSTTPVRPVFNASFRIGRSPSLNMLLEKGPNLLELIPSILMRFRERCIGSVSDIKQAFLQIDIKETDRDYLRFLWWKDAQCTEIITYRHKRVVFGVNCSPFLLMIVIFYHLSHVQPEQKAIALKLWRSYYVDNSVSSHDSMEEYEEFKSISTQLMQQAKMELRMWEHTDLQKAIPSSFVSVLGLRWDKVKDTLHCNISNTIPTKQLTKRALASEVQSAYDPCGFLTPALLIPKLLLRKAWQEGRKWSEEVSESIHSQYITWRKEAHLLTQVAIPRHFTKHGNKNIQIHAFCDASSIAYSTAIFIRCEDEAGVSVSLLFSKSRVAPLQVISISRLELLACLIGLRMTMMIKESLNYEKAETHFWTDSSNALSWICRNDKWGTFVGNRVREILQYSDTSQWHYVPSQLNPADLPSRGCSPSKLLDSKWWEGPQWLYNNKTFWPKALPDINELEISFERKKVTLAENNSAIACHWYLPFSSYYKNVTMIAFLLKWRKLGGRKRYKGITPSPLPFEEAELRMCQLVQNECFDENQTEIKHIPVQIGEDGLYRVKTKLLYREDSEFFLSPILLPSDHAFSFQLVKWIHHFYGHGGVPFTMAKVRERFWVMQCRRIAKRVTRACLLCKRLRAKAPVLPLCPLPRDRVEAIRPFSTIGIDLGGPLYLRDGTKVWFVIFTCAVFRCLHLELTNTLSTNGFLMCLAKFIYRRGRPSTVYSDNGTNLRGTVNLFKQLNWSYIEQETRVQRIRWKFIPPSSPWFGGFYERLVGLVKDCLTRILGNKRLGFIELETFLLEAEAIVNSRPLTYVREDVGDLIPLTPAMFIQPIPESRFPERELITSSTLDKQYKNLEAVRQELEERFRNEYLSILVQHAQKKPTKTLKCGDVVLVAWDNKKRHLWPMGRIIELCEGRDSISRVAKVQLPHHYLTSKDTSGKIKLEKVSNGPILVRPIRKLVPLEVEDENDLIVDQHAQNNAKNDFITTVDGYVTRFGRKIKLPERYSSSSH